MDSFILASTSAIRAQLLRQAGVPFTTASARIDEDFVTQALIAEGAKPRDIADTLAEMKARKVAAKAGAALVIGCDQVLECDGELGHKPSSPDDARDQLRRLRGKTHKLLSAAVIYQNAQPIWRHIGEARLTMRDFSDDYLEGYLKRNWPEIAQSVGGYMLESEGIRLFSKIEGSTFTIQGLPLIELLNYLHLQGSLPA